MLSPSVGDISSLKSVMPASTRMLYQVMSFLMSLLWVGAEFVARGFLLVDAGLLAVLKGLQVLEDVHQGHIVGLGEHGDVGE